MYCKEAVDQLHFTNFFLTILIWKTPLFSNIKGRFQLQLPHLDRKVQAFGHECPSIKSFQLFPLICNRF